MKVVILGDGLLGKELSSQTEWDVLSRKKDSADILNFANWSMKLHYYDVVVNCMAFTNTYDADREKSWNVNVRALDHLIDFCNEAQKKLVHISTDYIYSGSKQNCSEEEVPVHNNTFYSYTKLVGDALVQLRCKNFLLCRLSHKPTPFPYPKAWIDIQTNCDYVDVIASLVIKLIKNNATGVFNVGTKTKTIYDLALKTNTSVIPEKRPQQVPENTTMCLSKLDNFLNTLI